MVYTHILSSESVSAGHPDKVCDLISDTFVDAMIRRDPEARVACETMLVDGKVIVSGEFSAAPGVLDEVRREGEGLVRAALGRAGYSSAEHDIDPERCEIELRLNGQSAEIAGAVSQGGLIGAGDQGMMFGYATLETTALMPRALDTAQAIIRRAEALRALGGSPLRADGKCQVTIGEGRYGRETLLALVLSWQHEATASIGAVREYLRSEVIGPALEEAEVFGSRDARFHINPAGAWTIGGPKSDCGLTGRKIIVDTYGGAAPHGGGAFSGKDPTKVDRSGAYMARYLARHVVASGLSDACLVQLAYAIGQAEPVSVMVDTRGLGQVADPIIAAALQELFDLTPAGIIRTLDLRRPIYADTASGGHFGASRDPSIYFWETQPQASELMGVVGEVLRKKGGGRLKAPTRHEGRKTDGRSFEVVKSDLETAKDALLDRIKRRGFVTPQPNAWADMHAILRRHAGGSLPPPPVPMILSGWYQPQQDKHRALLAQLEWAELAGCLRAVCGYLNGLKDSDWDTRDDRRRTSSSEEEDLDIVLVDPWWGLTVPAPTRAVDPALVDALGETATEDLLGWIVDVQAELFATTSFPVALALWDHIGGDARWHALLQRRPENTRTIAASAGAYIRSLLEREPTRRRTPG